MSNSDAVNNKKNFMLALEGEITVHFIDEQTVVGIYLAQDDHHIVIKVDDAPLIIPRLQIRFIKGQSGQALIKDDSQTRYGEISDGTPRQGTSPHPIVEGVQDDSLQSQAEPDLYDDDDEGTVILDSSSSAGDLKATQSGFHLPEMGNEDEGTVILDSASREPISNFSASHPDSTADDADMDKTFIFDEVSTPPTPSKWTPGTGTDYASPNDATMILDEEDTPPPLPPTQSSTAGPYGVPRKAPPQLICTSGAHNGQVFTINTDVMIGRTSANEIGLVNDKEVSRRHATVTKKGEHYVIQDQNSLNGTFVNNQPTIGPYNLQDGDVVLIGVTYMTYKEG
ncbi:FHA domain-containing protein [Anaerolineales bacterium HSG25]|nr:FHA domain-containing protein [Anaerolineales bacterium HSG25]